VGPSVPTFSTTAWALWGSENKCRGPACSGFHVIRTLNISKPLCHAGFYLFFCHCDESDSLSIIHCYYDYIHRSMADDVNTLTVAAVLQYFVILVAC